MPCLSALVCMLAKELFPMKAFQNMKRTDKWGGDGELAA